VTRRLLSLLATIVQIPFHHAKAVQSALRANPAAELVVLPNGRHAELPPDFTSRLVRFFRAHLESPRK